MRRPTGALFAALCLLALPVLAGCGSEPDPEPQPVAPAPSAPGSSGTHETRADGAELLWRADRRSSAQNPAFAPDGRTLLFTVFHGGYNEGAAGLFTLPLDQPGTARPLLDEQGHGSVNLPGTSWNEATGTITFASDREERDEIWTVRPGSPPTRVTRHTGSAAYIEPSLSPAGDWIVFQDSPEGRDGLASIWKVRPDGSGLTRLVDGPATRSDNRQPNWSPRGDRIVFQRRDRNGDAWALYTVDPDGRGSVRITEADGESTDASWSPDGRWLVYSGNHGRLPEAQIFVVRADGGGQPVRVTKADAYDGAPAWSPDGRWIAFESHRGGGEGPTELWRIPAPPH